MMKNERYENTEQKPDVIAGRNPVSEAVRSNRPIAKILVAIGDNRNERWDCGNPRISPCHD